MVLAVSLHHNFSIKLTGRNPSFPNDSPVFSKVSGFSGRYNYSGHSSRANHFGLLSVRGVPQRHLYDDRD